MKYFFKYLCYFSFRKFLTFPFNIRNAITSHLKFKNLSKNWEKYFFHWEELHFEHIGNYVHTAEFLALVKALNTYINYSTQIDNASNESTSSIQVQAYIQQ